MGDIIEIGNKYYSVLYSSKLCSIALCSNSLYYYIKNIYIVTKI